MYALVVTPWIEPTFQRSRGGSASGNRHTETHHEARRRILESLFPPDAWELNDPRVKVLETDYGMLLLLDYRTQQGAHLEIHPCTLVLEIPGEKGKPPRHLALQAPDGAALEFDRKIDLRRAEIGRPIGGRLQGEVRIFSPPTQPSRSDQLEVRTQNVQINGQKVWTPHDVSFRFGNSYGSGRGLTIELLRANSGRSTEAGAFAIAGVRNLELAHLDRAHFEAPPQDMFASAVTKSVSTPARPDKYQEALKAPLEITCLGPFRFDFEEYVASFEDQVDVHRLNADGPSDQLNCRVLEIYFSPPQSQLPSGLRQVRAETPPAPPANSKEMGKNIVRRLVAVGHPVFVRAPSVGAIIQGDRLEYDVAAGRLRLENRRISLLGDGSNAEPASGNAILEHQGHYFAAPRMQYELGPDNRLGKLWASGPGVFRGPLPKTSQHLPEAPAGETLEVNWRGEIRLRPYDDVHVASIIGGAVAQVGQIGSFRAGELHVWLREVPIKPESPGKPEGSAEPDPAPRYQIVPDRMLAQQGVDLQSPRLSGATRKLEVWFEDAPVLPEDPSAQSPGSLHSQGESRVRQQAFDLRGELVQLRVLRRGKRATLEDATIRGGVLLRETRTEKPGETPLVVSGELVELRSASRPGLKLIVLGDAQRNIRAQAGSRGMAFTGWQLQVDQTLGRVWIDGPGRLTLPLRQQSLTRFSGMPAAGGRGPASLTVQWRKGLDFDGKRVLIEDAVETRGEGQVIHADSLQAFLRQPLDFSRPEQMEQVEVSRLLFGGRKEDVHGVALENHTAQNGVTTSMDQGHVRNLEVDVATGQLYALGPGWIESVRQGGFNLASPLSGAPSSPVPQGGPPGLTFLRVDFQEAITGQTFSQDMSQWKITFHKEVETMVGPVTRWEERLNADSPSGLGPRGMLLTSDELSIVQMGVNPQGDPQMELAATGRPHVMSVNFTADGDRLSYDGGKGLLVLEGGREDAKFWHRQNTGIEIDGAAQRIQYWPQENRLDADLRFLDLTGIRNALTPRLPRR